MRSYRRDSVARRSVRTLIIGCSLGCLLSLIFVFGRAQTYPELDHQVVLSLSDSPSVLEVLTAIAASGGVSLVSVGVESDLGLGVYVASGSSVHVGGLLDALAVVHGLCTGISSSILVIYRDESGCDDRLERGVGLGDGDNDDGVSNELLSERSPGLDSLPDVAVADVPQGDGRGDVGRVQEPTVENYVVRLRIIEISERAALSAGFDWGDSVFGTITTLVSGDVLGAARRFLSSDVADAIRFLESEGLGRKLDDLSTPLRSGVPASIQSGGTVSVNLVGGGQQNISTSYSYGLQSNITAEPIEGGALLDLSLQVQTPINISSPNLLNISDRSITNTLEVRCGEAVPLLTLFQLTEDGEGSGLPGVSRVPVVGYLAGSSSEQFARSSVVVTLDLVCAVGDL